ncbi:hypothetical protein PQX77_021731 [Marasmius sp. AFHP31]|nr:hypothetical protein PQX77_021731 [Marasmius sp. AFHP31]
MSLHNIFEHFRNALFQFYDVNPYPDDSTFKVGDRRLILSLLFDQWNKTLFGLLFQHFFLSRHGSLYWGYLVRYDHHQDEVYFCEAHFHTNLPLAARKFVNTVAEGIARVGFLSMKTALIPGAVQAWIDAVVFAAEAPAPPTLGYEELQFFAYPSNLAYFRPELSMSLHNIFEHFRNALFQFYDVNPYPDDSTFKVGDRRLILSLPFDQWNETLFGLLFQHFLFQHFFLSQHRSLYWGYLVRYDHHQDEVYFCEVHFHTNLPLAARKFVNTVAEGIACVGFLSMKTALIPGAVQAWIDAVVFAAEPPAPPTLGYEELQFFVFTPQMGRWLSRTPLAYCPLVCNLYYLDRLQQNEAWHSTDSEVDVPSVIPWYDHLDNSVLPSLFHLDA